MQGDSQLIGSSEGKDGVFLWDTSLSTPGIKPATLGLQVDPLYLLSLMTSSKLKRRKTPNEEGN